jgi:hypothetical protein
MHSTSRSTYPHYQLRTEPVMAMALQLTEVVNAMGWPPNQSHRKLQIHGFCSASVESLAHSHPSPLAPRSHIFSSFSSPLVRAYPSAPPPFRAPPSTPPLVHFLPSSPDVFPMPPEENQSVGRLGIMRGAEARGSR